MMNLEWLKNINSLLSQVIDLSESDFSTDKWLDLATNAVKHLGHFSSNPLSSPSSQVNPVNEPHLNLIPSSEKNSPKTNSTNLLKLLGPANDLIKQFTALGPFLQAFMKDAPNNEKPIKPTNPPNLVSSSSGHGHLLNTAGINIFVIVLLPILLLSLVLRFRLAR